MMIYKTLSVFPSLPARLPDRVYSPTHRRLPPCGMSMTFLSLAHLASLASSGFFGPAFFKPSLSLPYWVIPR
jgi:hypothetical protein